MAISVKNKIRLGTLFLFLLLLLSGGLGIYNVVRLKNDAKMILEANYETLGYCHIMQRQLDSQSINRQVALQKFESALQKQEGNITEPGEGNATATLRWEFNKLKSGNVPDSVVKNMYRQLYFILTANMNAIERKNNTAQIKADNALNYLSLIATIVFMIALTFSYNFPSVVINPIRNITEAIHEIAGKNYKHRIHIKNKDEFGEMADAFNAMAERLEYFESSNLNKLMFEKSRAEAVINSLKDASMGIDKNNTVLFANNQALQLLGVQAKDIVGLPTTEVASKNDLFKFLLHEKNNIPFKIVVDTKENYFTKEMVEVQQEDAKNTVIVVKNITSFKELDVAKTNFIATVSHELKTPLASSDFSLKLLEDNRIGNEERKELIQQLKSDNQRMLRILSELLNMSQIEAGKIQLDIQSVSPYQIVENSINAVTTTAREKGLDIKKQIGADLPDIKADPDKINWVLNNFLTNAIKYAPSGTAIIIEVQKTGNQISFSVSDKGQGIDEAYLNRIFERYFQVPGRSDKKGSGIGLAICKEFIEAMGGKIWVKSKLSEGSKFGFDLPV